jgi:hypothetical protein
LKIPKNSKNSLNSKINSVFYKINFDIKNYWAI